jgi:Zn-dependent protease with chaperone function
VVLPSAALAAPDEAHLQAVLAHESAQLRSRHHTVAHAATSLARAFPHPAVFRIAAAETARLIELGADDEAAGRTDPPDVAAALLAPTGALAADGSGAPHGNAG